MSKFGRMLGALTCAALTVGLSVCSANASDNRGGYHGRTVGPITIHGPQKSHNVRVYRGGAFLSRSRALASSRSGVDVAVYGGGGGTYVNYMPVPDYLENLEVVTVTRGAGARVQSIDAQCAGPNGERMPAARTRRSPSANGTVELFRCEQGLTLHGYVSPSAHAANGREIVCATGMSLWRTQDGSVSCSAKSRLTCWTPGGKEACSEALLRHTYGTGKILAGGARQKDHAAVIVTRGLSLNGGVGYRPF